MIIVIVSISAGWGGGGGGACRLGVLARVQGSGIRPLPTECRSDESCCFHCIGMLSSLDSDTVPLTNRLRRNKGASLNSMHDCYLAQHIALQLHVLFISSFRKMYNRNS